MTAARNAPSAFQSMPKPTMTGVSTASSAGVASSRSEASVQMSMTGPYSGSFSPRMILPSANCLRTSCTTTPAVRPTVAVVVNQPSSVALTGYHFEQASLAKPEPGDATPHTDLAQRRAGLLAVAETLVIVIAGGTLLVAGSLDAASAVSVTGGNLGGTGTIGGPLSVSNVGNLSPGLVASTGILHTANVAFAAGGNFLVNINGSTADTQYDQLDVNGTIDLTTGDVYDPDRFLLRLRDGRSIVISRLASRSSACVTR